MIPQEEIHNLSVALYSNTQKCYHVERMSDLILSNARGMGREKDNNDFRLIGVFNSTDESLEYIAKTREQMEEIKERKREERRNSEI